jgi:hypothetical protein
VYRPILQDRLLGWSHRGPRNATERQISRLKLCSANLEKDRYASGRHSILHSQRFCAPPLHSLCAGPTGDTTFPNLSRHASEMSDPAIRRTNEAAPVEEQRGRAGRWYSASHLDPCRREGGRVGGSCLSSMRRRAWGRHARPHPLPQPQRRARER